MLKEPILKDDKQGLKVAGGKVTYTMLMTLVETKKTCSQEICPKLMKGLQWKPWKKCYDISLPTKIGSVIV